VRLFHFSDDPTIDRFVPRAVQVPSARPEGKGWLNGPLVWAIDDWHAPLYLFPRDCPRIVMWRKPDTTEADLDRYWQARDCRMIAHIEWAWFERFRAARLYRYELPIDGFKDLGDVGMHVCRRAVGPLTVTPLGELANELRTASIELRVMESLLPLRRAWDTSLHVSGIRLRNAQGWEN
jgi:hypothetical protein